MIPAACPNCGAQPQYEGNTHTLYLCGSVVTIDAAGNLETKVGQHCRPPGTIPLRG